MNYEFGPPEFVCRKHPCPCIEDFTEISADACGCESDDAGNCLYCKSPLVEEGTEP